MHYQFQVQNNKIIISNLDTGKKTTALIDNIERKIIINCHKPGENKLSKIVLDVGKNYPLSEIITEIKGEDLVEQFLEQT